MNYRENMSPEALASWDRLVQKYGNLNVTSAYRSPEHNHRVGGAKGSQHLHGNAFDISTAGMSQDQVNALIADAQASGFGGIGVYDGSLHFDVGPERAWGSDYTRNSLPEWVALGPTGQHSAPTQPQNVFAGGGTQQQPQTNALRGNLPALDPSAFMVARAPAQKLAFS